MGVPLPLFLLFFVALTPGGDQSLERAKGLVAIPLLTPGMTRVEVERLLGEEGAVSTDGPKWSDRTYYGHDLSVRFSAKDKVISARIVEWREDEKVRPLHFRGFADLLPRPTEAMDGMPLILFLSIWTGNDCNDQEMPTYTKPYNFYGSFWR